MTKSERELIEAVLARFLDGEPEPEDGELLARAMREDGRFASEVVRFLVLDDLLRQDALADDGAFIDSVKMRLGAAPMPDEFLRRFKGWGDRGVGRARHGVGRWVAVSALVGLTSMVMFIAGLAYWGVVPGVQRLERAAADERARPGSANKAVAVLTRVVDAHWADAPGFATEEGSALPAGRLSLDSGLAQIEFISGASVILEGPCEFELVSLIKAICHRGKVRAHVPPQARGFTISAHGVDAVDLGTEFGVRVDEGGRGEVHVLDGEVEVHGMTGGTAGGGVTTLTSGRGINFSGDGVRAIAAQPAEFVSRARILELEEAHQRRRYSQWLAHSQGVRSDPATVLYYGFEEHNTWERSLKDGTGRCDGAVVGCLWCPGRWPGKAALEFKRLSDRVRIDVPGEFSELTLAAWVRVEGLNNWLSSLMLTDGWELGEVHWQINAKGELILGVRLGDGPDDGHRSPPVLTPKDLGRWVHLATTYDSRRNVVTHYVDGAAVSRGALPVATLVKIGAANIGNWNAPPTYHEPIRSLNGRIDEFVISRRALADHEISRMYEIGKPST
jgi:Concanavalin A-like lectin/glucanases superfamily/FecR protein